MFKSFENIYVCIWNNLSGSIKCNIQVFHRLLAENFEMQIHPVLYCMFSFIDIDVGHMTYHSNWNDGSLVCL